MYLTCNTILVPIGSSAQYIIYNSEVPVMSIHPEVKINEVYSFP